MDIKRIVMAGGVLATAGAIGFVMQNGEAAKARYAGEPVPDISGTANDPLQVTDIKLTSAVAGSNAKEPVVSGDVASSVKIEADEKIVEPEIKTAALGASILPEPAKPALTPPASLCDIELDAKVAPAAMVDVSLNANCYPNERVTFHHNGMMFTHATGKDGTLDLSIPALSKNAVFIVAFANGEGALASAKVPELESFDRMVVQSKAKSELHINAFEFGAGFREKGHVSADSNRSIEESARGVGGFITMLGDHEQGEALVAEVYTFPTGASVNNGDIHVSVDANVTLANCGLRVEAQTLEVIGSNPLKVQDLTLPIPDCGAVGDFLVLQNLLQDLKVARN